MGISSSFGVSDTGNRGASGATSYQGTIDASTNPDFPYADTGHVFYVSTDGTIGGEKVNSGDQIICKKNTTSGKYSSVGDRWDIIRSNKDGRLKGPAQSNNDAIPVFDSAKGDVLKDSGRSFTDELVSDSFKIPSSKTVKDAIDLKLAANPQIVPGTNTKITYDSNGLITKGERATTDDIPEAPNKRYVTDVQKTSFEKITGINTGDETQDTIKTKLGAASSGADGFLTKTDWNTFDRKQAALGFTPENIVNKENKVLDGSEQKYPTNNLVTKALDTKINKTDLVKSINDSEIQDGQLAIFSKSNADIRTSKKTITNVLTNADEVIPTSKAVKDVTDGKISGPISSKPNSIMVFDGTNGKVAKDSRINVDTLIKTTGSFVQFRIDSPRVGVQLPMFVPFGCNIVGWDLITENTDTVELDVIYNETFSAPMVSITGNGIKPNTKDFKSNSGTDLTSWITRIEEGGILTIDIKKAPSKVGWLLFKLRVI